MSILEDEGVATMPWTQRSSFWCDFSTSKAKRRLFLKL